MRGIARSPSPRPAALLLALPFLISAVLGIGVQIQPDIIQDGGPISITLSNVTDGYNLNTTLAAAFAPVPGVSWLNFTNWNYPFALDGGMVTVRGQNVNRITLIVRAGGVIKGAPPKPGTGDVTVELPMDFPPSLFHDFRIGYEVHNASAPLMFTLVQQGTKAGPEDAVLTPSIIGVKEGNLTVKILTNGTLQGSKEIRIRESVPLPTPTEGNTTVTPSPSPTPPRTTLPVTTPPTPVPSPSVSPPVAPSPLPLPSPEGPSPWIIVYIAVIIIVTILADYIILKD
ncbi:MAG: hypothetical protein LUQ32_01710 [Methanomicrobiales archaeon]|nr:hypothetical protein [Methanomicrobiales archaeon]